MKRLVLSSILFLLLVSFVSAQQEPNHIISNSEDWQDVYSTMLYGSLSGRTTHFLVSNRHAPLLLNGIPADAHVWSISSEDVPFVIGYKNIIESRGMTAEEFVYSNVNLELASQLDVSNFVVVDDSYGYNAISVAPYAVATNSYVLFADANTIDAVEDYLSSIDAVDNIIIYGHVDREVKNALEPYNPEKQVLN